MDKVVDIYGREMKPNSLVYMGYLDHINEKIVLRETKKSLVVSNFKQQKTGMPKELYDESINKVEYHNSIKYLPKKYIRKNSIVVIKENVPLPQKLSNFLKKK